MVEVMVPLAVLVEFKARGDELRCLTVILERSVGRGTEWTGPLSWLHLETETGMSRCRVYAAIKRLCSGRSPWVRKSGKNGLVWDYRVSPAKLKMFQTAVPKVPTKRTTAPKAPTAQSETVPGPQALMFEVVCAECGFDYAIMGDRDKGRVGRVAKSLLKAGATHEEVREAAKEWSGQTWLQPGSKPSPETLLTWVGKVRREKSGTEARESEEAEEKSRLVRYQGYLARYLREERTLVGSMSQEEWECTAESRQAAS